MPRYAIGIDLGTTNTALAYIPLTGRPAAVPAVHTFEIAQWADIGEPGSGELLPSCLYLPRPGEWPDWGTALPWASHRDYVVGLAAQRLGAKVPGQLVNSAKSWLCHGGVDREAAILPWHADPELPRVSPVEASSRYLEHLREAWNASKGTRPADRFEKQQIVLTVPASFDEMARDLTVLAARRAGLEHFTLLEEPQAAFYAWMYQPKAAGPRHLPVGAVCLVLDVGGGTTDFSLIITRQRDGEPYCERLAVGDHLMLGGDNFDWALARDVEQKVSPGARLDPTQWGSLVQTCRLVKERMLGPEPPESQTVTVLGRGRGVIGGSLRCVLHREEVIGRLLDGFLPMVEAGDRPAREQAGLREFGLSFAADPAITRHLAEFLGRHQPERRDDAASLAPAALLYNGGVFKAEPCRERILEVLRRWFGPAWSPQVLDTGSLELAVARGAAYYAWARVRGSPRIEGGAGRSYYVNIHLPADSEHAAARDAWVCLVPQGMEEGESTRIDQLPLVLQVGEPVAFALSCSTVRPQDKPGDIVDPHADQLRQLPPMTTLLRSGRRAAVKQVPVNLQATVTEWGTLELFCAAKDGGQRWQLRFQARAFTPPRSAASESDLLEDPSAAEMSAPSPEVAATTTESEIWSVEQLAAARGVIADVFTGGKSGGNDPRLAVGMMRQLEQALELPKADWPTAALRGLWESIDAAAEGRRLSLEHECRWYNLAGFCLRPGFGDLVDGYRVEQLWKRLHTGVLRTKETRAWAEYWVLWRRVSGGLDTSRQQELSNRLWPHVQPGRRPAHRAGAHESAEIWRTLASLERLSVADKQRGGELLLAALRRPKDSALPPAVAFWGLARFGARQPLYAPANLVLPPSIAEAWLDRLLRLPLTDPRVGIERDFALVQLARCTGDRGRDIDDHLRKQLLEHLTAQGAPARWRQLVEQVTELGSAEQSRLLGDSLPPGLRLARAAE